ncbi:MAG: hypothetical protein HC942_26600 [Microcoleus sp. SU_5_6]|nr:hypothetical protein [Microcoleus sp. SU_5_6]
MPFPEPDRNVDCRDTALPCPEPDRNIAILLKPEVKSQAITNYQLPIPNYQYLKKAIV